MLANMHLVNKSMVAQTIGCWNPEELVDLPGPLCYCNFLNVDLTVVTSIYSNQNSK